VSGYSPTLTVDITPNPPSTSELPDPADSLGKECTVQTTFVDSHVNLTSENEALVLEDQMSDLPCELLYHL
jgi:hypothetical protein